MMAMPSGASGTGTSQRWIKSRPARHPLKDDPCAYAAGGKSLNSAAIPYSPTNTASRSIAAFSLCCAIARSS
jgi:hypothetical protein